MDMDERQVKPDEILTALRGLEATWEKRAAESQAMVQKLRIGDPNQSYYRGMAEAYKAALKDLRGLLNPGEVASPVAAEEHYIPVNRERVRLLLERAGLTVNDLHAHKDNTFSAVFAPLQVLTMDERIVKITSLGDVAILDTGKLPNTSKPYIDFAFRSAPE
jgi:hypothetical protein